MVKSEIYIGLHDSTTKTQLFESEKYIRVLRNVCHSYKVPFSFGIQEGGYIYENGEYARETSLVLTLIETHTEKTVIAMSSRTLPDVSTLSNRSLLIIGENMPMSDRASVARAIITKSEAECVRTIYEASEGRLIFFSGKGL